MPIISRRAIREFVERYPLAESALSAWYRVAKEADWSNLAEVREVYPHADPVGRYTVFNIHGNRYRLIARVNYEYRRIYIRHIMTHKEYDKGDWKNGC